MKQLNSISEITLESLKEAVYEAVTAKITSIAPLGYSSPTILLYGKDGNERRSGVSIRNHSGEIEMLICDSKGSFIFYGGFNKNLPIAFISMQLWKTFKSVKKHIETEMPNNNELEKNVVKNPHYTSGFDLLHAAQCAAYTF